MVKEVTTDSFQTFLQSNKPVVVDFYATWCGPCKMLSPLLEQIATEYAEKIEVGKLDVDAHPEIAQQYGVMSMPTLLMFENGQVTKQLIGYRPKNQLLEDFSEVL